MALKLGTENRTKTYAAVGLLAIVVILAVHFVYDNFFSTPSSTPAPAAAVVSAPATPVSRSARSSDAGLSGSGHAAEALRGASALDPTLHPELMAQAENTTYTGNGRNIFSPDSTPTVAPKIEAVRGPIRPQPVVPAGPPPPPNIDLKFYGFATEKGSRRRAFLSHGEDIFIATEGDVVDRRYKVVKINPFSIEVEDLAFNHTQTLPLIQN